MLSLNEAWNKREIPAPNDLIKVAVNQRIIDCLERGVQVFSSALETLRDAAALRTELFVVSRYLHRRKAQIRRHKTRQVLSQVQSCLRRLGELNLNALMTRNHKLFLKARRSQQSGGMVYLPSRGMLEQVLVRLMGGAGVLVQTVNYCVNATLVLQADVKLAHLLPSTMMCLAAVSRIWACSRSLYLDYLSWYSSLLPELKDLPKGQVWLSEEEEFPRVLTLWLNSRLDMEHVSRSPVSIDETMKCVSPQVTLSAEGSSQPSQDDSDQDLAVPQQRIGEDIGAPVMISREDLGIKHNTAATRPKKKKCLEDVTIETESSSDEEPSSRTYRNFQKQTKRCDSDDSSDPSSWSPPREKPRLMGLKRRHEEGSKSSTITKKLRQGDAERGSPASPDDSDLAVPQQGTDVDIGALVMTSRKDLGIKHNTAATRPKKKKCLEDVTIETESSSDDEPSSKTYRNFQKQTKRYDSDDSSDPSSRSPPREKPRLMGLKRRHEEGSKPSTISTKKLRQGASNEDVTSKSIGLQKDLKESQSVISERSKVLEQSVVNVKTQEQVSVKRSQTSSTSDMSSSNACDATVSNSNKRSKNLPVSVNVRTQKSKSVKHGERSLANDMSSLSRIAHADIVTVSSSNERSKTLPESETNVKRQEAVSVKRLETSSASDMSKSSQNACDDTVTLSNSKKRSKSLSGSVVNVEVRDSKSVKSKKTSTANDMSKLTQNACDDPVTVANLNKSSKNLSEIVVKVKTQELKSVNRGERSSANGMSSLSRNACPVEMAVTSSNKRSNNLSESEVEVETQESRPMNHGEERSFASSMSISSTNAHADAMAVTNSNKRSKNLPRSEVNIQTLESTSLKRLETSSASGVSSSSKNACDNTGTVSNSNKRSNNLPEPVVKVETQESTSVNHGARSFTNSMSGPSTNTHADEIAVTNSNKRSNNLPVTEVKVETQESMSVNHGARSSANYMSSVSTNAHADVMTVMNISNERSKISSANDMSNSSDDEMCVTSAVESHKHPGHVMSASTSHDSSERNVYSSSDDQNSSESDEENQETPNVPDQPSTDNLVQTNSQHKRLKRDINDCVDVQGVVDIFFRLKPEGTSTSSPWDPWPDINLQKKTELFNKKFESIENCVRKTPKRKVLPKLKVHCFRFMKEIQDLTKRGIAEMMTREAITQFVGELGESKLTWLGKTVILPARKAKIVKLDLESLLRKMLKVTNNVKRFVLLQTKAGRIITRAVQSV